MAEKNTSTLIIAIDSTDAERSAKDTERALEALEAAGLRATRSTDKLGKESKDTARELKKLDSNTKSTTGGISKMSVGMVALSAHIAAVAATALSAKAALDTFRNFDTLQASLVTATGSMDSAKLKMEELIVLGKDLPSSIESTIDSFSKLKNLGLDPTTEAIIAYSNVAAGLGKDLNQFIEAVADASTGEMERLKEFGIISRKEGDKIKFTFQGITTEIENSGSAIESYLRAIGQNQFAGAAARQADTLDGSIDSLSDSLADLTRRFGEVSGTKSAMGGFFDFLSEKMDEVNEKMFGPTTLDGLVAKRNELQQQIANIESAPTNQSRSNAVSQTGRHQLLAELAEIEKQIADLRSATAEAERLDNAQRAAANEAAAAEALELRRKTEREKAEIVRKALNRELDNSQQVYNQLLAVADPAAAGLNVLKDQLDDLDKLLANGRITQEQYVTALGAATQEYADLVVASDPWLSRVKELNAKYVEQNGLLQALKDKRDASQMTGDNAAMVQSGADSALTSALTAGAPQVAGLDPMYSGAFGEANRLDQAAVDQTAWYEQRKAELQQYEDDKLGLAEEAAAAREELERNHQQTIAQIEQQSAIARMQGYSGLFGQLATMSATYAGDSAGITQGLVAFQQAADLASTISSIAKAKGDAAADGVTMPQKIANMVAIASATAGLVTTISSITSPKAPTFKSSSYAGAFDNGGEIASGKWGIVGEIGPEIVEGPARVTGRKDTAKMLSEQSGGGDIIFSPTINIKAEKGMSAADSRKQGERIADGMQSQFRQLILAEQRPGGLLYKR